MIPEVLIAPSFRTAPPGSRKGFTTDISRLKGRGRRVIDEAGLVASLPVEAHDARMDVIITQERVLMRKDDRR